MTEIETEKKSKVNAKWIAIPLVLVACAGIGWGLVSYGVIPIGQKQASVDAPAVSPGSSAPGAPAPGAPQPTTAGAPKSGKPDKAASPKAQKAALAAAKKAKALASAKAAKDAKLVAAKKRLEAKGAAATAAAAKAKQVASAGPAVPHFTGVREDPFSAYKNSGLVKLARDTKLRTGFQVGTLAPVDFTKPSIDNQGQPGNPFGGQNVANGNAPGPTGPQGPTGTAAISLPWKVAGIMTGSGVKAILVNGDQSQIVQPGDLLQGDTPATVVKITETSVTVQTTGEVKQLVLLDKNGSSSGNGGSQPGNPGNPGQPPAGYRGPGGNGNPYGGNPFGGPPQGMGQPPSSVYPGGGYQIRMHGANRGGTVGTID